MFGSVSPSSRTAIAAVAVAAGLIAVPMLLTGCPALSRLYAAFGPLRVAAQPMNDKLAEAVRNGDHRQAGLLLAAGADPDYLQDPCYGEHLIVTAVSNQDQPMIKLLLDAGASCAEGYYSHSVWDVLTARQDQVTLDFMLETIQDLGQFSSGDKTALRSAVKANWPYMVKVLLEKGVDPDVVFNNEPNYGASILLDASYFKETALTLSVRNQNLELVKLLLDGGADVNVAVDEYSPLLIAMKAKASKEVILAIVAAGADVNFPEPCDRVENGMIFTGNAMGDDGRRRRSALHFAATCGDASVYQALIDAGAELESSDWEDATPLFYAARYHNKDGVRLLLAAGADPNNFKSLNVYPLHFAAGGTCFDNVKALVEAGAEVNCLNVHEWTPLRQACDGCKNIETVRYLLAHGADPLLADEDGLTPLQSLQNNPVEKAHDWEGHLETCSLEQLKARRLELIEMLGG